MDKRMTDIMKLARIELIIIPIFIFFKAIRPKVLDSAAPEIFKITLLSLPNFFEAVIGTLTLTGVGLLINDRLSQAQQLKPKFIYIIAVVLAACYVIAQELNLITLRANGTTDPFDVLFSIIGLAVGYATILYVKPIIQY